MKSYEEVMRDHNSEQARERRRRMAVVACAMELAREEIKKGR